MNANAPLKINLYRGGTVESSHRAHCMIMGRGGEIIGSWGDESRLISPRSSLKALQALPFVESGAVDAFGLGDEEIALACASHNAEPVHMEIAERWLTKIGLGVKDLQCGGHLSINVERAHEMIRTGENLKFTGLHSDCSGKHCGMLSAARHMGAPVGNYLAFDHPVQRRIFETISEMADYEIARSSCGTDGCSAPNPALPLRNLTLAFLRLANPDGRPPARAAASRRILDAIAGHPYLIGGKDRFDTILIESTKGNVIGKIGAEGNYMAIIRDRGIVLYMKTEDGAIERALCPVLGVLLRKLDVLSHAADAALERFTRPVLKNWKGVEIGKVTVTGAGLENHA